MNVRIQNLREKLQVDKYPICIERALLMTESYQKTEGRPMILTRAEAHAHLLDNITIFIEDNELIVGNVASKPMGVEVCPDAGIWTQGELDATRLEGFSISDEEMKALLAINLYWKGKNRATTEGDLYDDRIIPYMQSGVSIPRWKNKEEGVGGLARGGMGIGSGKGNGCVDYAKVIYDGLSSIIAEAEEKLKMLRFNDEHAAEAIEKAYFLKSVIIANKAVIRFAYRFADLATEMAVQEGNLQRKKELERIAETCRRVPAYPARTFFEAMQSFWFIFLMANPSPTAPGGRFDQYMYPFYKKDKETGRMNDEEVLELLQCLRIKDMQLNHIQGTAKEKLGAGHAKWNNFIIGGVTPEGKDATNELSFLVLEAAIRCQTPHHTLTLRVHDKTPDALMIKALELVRTGIGMPAFVGDKSYVEHFLSHGVPLKTARDYVLGGCIESAIPGNSLILGAGALFAMSKILEMVMNNGYDDFTGKYIGPKTGDIDSFETFEEFMNALKRQFAHFISLATECLNISLHVSMQIAEDPFLSSLMVDAIEAGKDRTKRVFVYDNAGGICVVGMITLADSLAAIKKLVFDEKKVSLKGLKAAIDANWEGYEELRTLCLKAPKFGNDDDYVDLIAADLYKFFADTTLAYKNIYGRKVVPAAISVSGHWPAGEISGATPDGRHAHEALTDAAVSAMRGMDTHGPTALIKSASKVDQMPFQSVLFNMKFHPSALKTQEDLLKLASLIKTYFSLGGRHVQFNVVSKEMLTEAQQKPEQHRDLIVRVAGYSAYFVQLGKAVQDEVVNRTSHDLN